MNNSINFQEGISHLGIVLKISKDSIEVAIEGNVHCEACHAKSACGVSDAENKIVVVKNEDSSIVLHEQVHVLMNTSLGLKAVFYGYVLPFILLFVVLFVASVYIKEWQAGLLALFVLIPYYLILYFNEQTLKKTFSMRILKQH